VGTVAEVRRDRARDDAGEIAMTPAERKAVAREGGRQVNKQRGWIQIPTSTLELLFLLACIGAIALVCVAVGVLWFVVAHVDVVIR
jgi:hypothetical protein